MEMESASSISLAGAAWQARWKWKVHPQSAWQARWKWKVHPQSAWQARIAQSAEQGQFLHACHFLLNKKAESVLGRWRVIMSLFQAICHLFYILNILRISLKTSPKQSIWQSAEQGQFLHSCHFLLNKKAESVLGRWRVIVSLFQAICHSQYTCNVCI